MVFHPDRCTRPGCLEPMMTPSMLHSEHHIGHSNNRTRSCLTPVARFNQHDRGVTMGKPESCISQASRSSTLHSSQQGMGTSNNSNSSSSTSSLTTQSSKASHNSLLACDSCWGQPALTSSLLQTSWCSNLTRDNQAPTTSCSSNRRTQMDTLKLLCFHTPACSSQPATSSCLHACCSQVLQAYSMPGSISMLVQAQGPWAGSGGCSRAGPTTLACQGPALVWPCLCSMLQCTSSIQTAGGSQL